MKEAFCNTTIANPEESTVQPSKLPTGNLYLQPIKDLEGGAHAFLTYARLVTPEKRFSEQVADLTKWGLLDFRDKDVGIQEVSINVRELMKDRFQEFQEKLSKFTDSNDSREHTVCHIEGDFLVYETESLHPKLKKRKRTALLLLFGNPAPRSVKGRMFFSYEGNKKEHRFWKVLAESGIFRLDEQVDDLNERNRLKKKKLYEVSYYSPFQIHLDVFYSMPSPAAGKWSGVAGLRRLFSAQAFEEIAKSERLRVESLIKRHLSPNGLILAFQKDAYLQTRSAESPDYCLARNEAMGGETSARCRFDERIKLYCMAPTRLMYKNLGALRKIRDALDIPH